MTIASILGSKGRDLFRLSPNSSLRDVVQLLSDQKIGVVLLMEGDALEGILSERDVVKALSSCGSAALDEPARAYMTGNVIACSESDTIVTVMTRMTEGRFRHMPVVADGKVVGLVSIGDVVKSRIEETQREVEDMRAYIAAG